jgi:hypothetical protein
MCSLFLTLMIRGSRASSRISAFLKLLTYLSIQPPKDSEVVSELPHR